MIEGVLTRNLDRTRFTKGYFANNGGNKMNTISLRLPTSLHNATREIAKKEHISIMLAVAEKLSALGAEEAIFTALSEKVRN
jgi:hypothetical protein